MTQSEMSLFLYAMMFVCSAMAILNLVKNHKRGTAAYVLSTAFLVFAVTIYLYKRDAPQLYVRLGASVLILLIAADFILRAGTAPPRKKR